MSVCWRYREEEVTTRMSRGSDVSWKRVSKFQFMNQRKPSRFTDVSPFILFRGSDACEMILQLHCLQDGKEGKECKQTKMITPTELVQRFFLGSTFHEVRRGFRMRPHNFKFEPSLELSINGLFKSFWAQSKKSINLLKIRMFTTLNHHTTTSSIC